MATKSSKKRKKGDSPGKALRAASIRAKSLEGKTNGEIAREMGMNPKSVSQILNSDETKKIIKEAESKVVGMVEDSLITLHEAIKARYDMTNALKGAFSVLKNFGILKDKVDINHQFPAPLVIERLDGGQVILGTAGDKEEGKE